MLKKFKIPVPVRYKEAKVLLFDIENAPHKGMFWDGIFEQNILATTEYGYPLSYSHKWLGNNTVYVRGLNHYTGSLHERIRKLLVDLHKVMGEADIIVGHNVDQFDIKKANAYFVRYGLAPLPARKTVCTKKVAKKYFKFNSNKLNELGDYLGIGHKIPTGGFDLWKRCMKMPIDKQAWALMLRYNKMDVILLEKVYLKLRPWMTNHPNVNFIDRPACRACGSSKIQYRGYAIAGKKPKRRVQCQNPECGTWDTISIKAI